MDEKNLLKNGEVAETFDIIKIIKDKIEKTIGKRSFIRFLFDVEISFCKDYRISFFFGKEKVKCENLVKSHKNEIICTLQNLWPKIDLNIEFIYLEEEERKVISLTYEEFKERKIFEISDYGNGFSFENFYESKSNQFASQVIKSISCYNDEQLIQNCGIFYLNGKSGLGKTHLIKSSYNFYSKKGGSCCQMTAVEFTKKYVDSVQKRNIGDFFNYFLNYEMIYIENINYLIGKKSTLETLIFIIKEMMNKEVSVIFSSDLPLEILLKKEEKFNQIKDFFVDLKIEDLDLQTKKDFVIKQISMRNLKIPIFSAEVISKNSVNYRDIKKNLDKISVYQKIHNVELNSSLIEEILVQNEPDRIENKTNANKWNDVSEEKVINLVADFFKIDCSSIFTAIKTSQVCFARSVAIFLLHRYKGLNFSNLGKIFKKNHSTIISNVQKINTLLQEDSKFPMQLSSLKDLILR